VQVLKRLTRLSVLLGLNEGLFGDENSVKELTLIFLSDSDALVDAGGAEGNVGVIVSGEDELILDIGVKFDGDTLNHIDVLDLFSTQEVLDINGLLVLGADGVDGEMSVDQFHAVNEALYMEAYN